MIKRSQFLYFRISLKVIRLAVLTYIRIPFRVRNAEDLLHERCIDICHETVSFWWNSFGPLFATELRTKRVSQLRAYSNWQWHWNEVFVRIDGERHYLWRAVDHEGEVLGNYVTRRRDRKAVLKFLWKTIKCHLNSHSVVTDKLRYCGAAMNVVCNADQQETGRWLNNRAKNLYQLFR